MEVTVKVTSCSVNTGTLFGLEWHWIQIDGQLTIGLIVLLCGVIVRTLRARV